MFPNIYTYPLFILLVLQWIKGIWSLPQGTQEQWNKAAGTLNGVTIHSRAHSHTQLHIMDILEVQNSMQPIIHVDILLILLRASGNLLAISEYSGHKVRDILDTLPMHHRAQSHLFTYLHRQFFRY